MLSGKHWIERGCQVPVVAYRCGAALEYEVFGYWRENALYGFPADDLSAIL